MVQGINLVGPHKRNEESGPPSSPEGLGVCENE